MVLKMLMYTANRKLLDLLPVAHKVCKSAIVSMYSSHQCQQNLAPFFECSGSSASEIAHRGLKVIEEFVTEEEEAILLSDIEPKWRRLKYQQAHWDNVSSLQSLLATTYLMSGCKYMETFGSHVL